MNVRLADEEQALLAGDPGLAMAMRIVVECARLLGAERLVPIESAHADGCLYHGDSGVHFVEHLVESGCRVAVPTTCNVGALDLLHPGVVKSDPHHQSMAGRLMQAHVRLGCQPTWTCAPYQAGHRPGFGSQVAWGESNAVAFVNSVLGARTNRYGDFLDICCAITCRAPYCGLHVPENRRATILIDTGRISEQLKSSAAFYPLLGAWLGRVSGARVAAIDGIPLGVSEDKLKALGAGAASTGSVGLFHILGVTPEAPDRDAAFGGLEPEEIIELKPEMILQSLEEFNGAGTGKIDCVAVGSPHYSVGQRHELDRLISRRRLAVPIYLCTNRQVTAELEQDGSYRELEEAGVVFIVDTCVVVTPILRGNSGVMMTDSAKFAHYGKGNTGYDTVFGAIEDCVESALCGEVKREAEIWS